MKLCWYRWITLWDGPPQCSAVPKQSRIFSPPIRKIDFPTKYVHCDLLNLFIMCMYGLEISYCNTVLHVSNKGLPLVL